MELGKSIEEVEEDSRAFLGGEGEEEEDRSADRQPVRESFRISFEGDDFGL